MRSIGGGLDRSDKDLIVYIIAHREKGLGDDDHNVVYPSSMDVTCKRSESELHDT